MAQKSVSLDKVLAAGQALGKDEPAGASELARLRAEVDALKAALASAPPRVQAVDPDPPPSAPPPVREADPVVTWKIPKEMHGQFLREPAIIANQKKTWRLVPGSTVHVPRSIQRTALGIFSAYADQYRLNMVNRGKANDQYLGHFDG